ncbi:MAG: hypothetical protein SFW67_37125 [Myxococcaceae bacterium]|nr:hypothetical protein [Myxococcaceae bacterium]
MSVTLVPASALRTQALSRLSAEADPIAELATLLLADSELVVALSRQIDIQASMDCEQSLVGVDPELVPSMDDAISALHMSLPPAQPSLWITCAQPSVKPTDPLVSELPWSTVNEGRVYLHVALSGLGVGGFAEIVRMSQGYPSGVVLVHSGSLLSPTAPVWACLSAFDGETFLVWWSPLG